MLSRSPLACERPPAAGSPDAHYPSWGIGIIRATIRPMASLTAHYPSWGSGSSSATHIVVPSHHSLPLMGIGIVAGFNQERLTDLISLPPHGDRDPVHRGRRRRERSDQAHYPFMGIGIATCRQGTGSRRHLLTTPHGDRDLQLSKGICHAAPPLTTPHGDRGSRRRCRPSRASRGAHYPSWGSGIRMEAAELNALAHRSLPLMPDAYHAVILPSPLTTPHGDRGSPVAAGMAHRHPPLTTPHGDRGSCC